MTYKISSFAQSSSSGGGSVAAAVQVFSLPKYNNNTAFEINPSNSWPNYFKLPLICPNFLPSVLSELPENSMGSKALQKTARATVELSHNRLINIC